MGEQDPRSEDVRTEIYGDYARILSDSPPWITGAFPLPDGSMWEMREPEAVTIVRNGFLWVGVAELTRHHDRHQILDNAKHILFSTRRFEVPADGGVSFELSMRVRRKRAVEGDLYDAYASFLCLDFTNGVALDFFVAEDIVASVFARLPFPGLELEEARPMKYWALFEEKKVVPSEDGFHRVRLVIEPSEGIFWWVDGTEIARKPLPSFSLGSLMLGLGIMTEKDITPEGSVSVHGQGVLAEWSPIEIKTWKGRKDPISEP